MQRLATAEHPNLIICHTQEILDQTCETIAEYLGEENLGRLESGKKNWKLDRPYLVGLVQGLSSKKRLEERRQLAQSVSALYLDEAHHSASDTWVQLAAELANTHYRFGLTGTPFRADGADLMLEAVTGPISYRQTHREMVERDWLVMPSVYMVNNHLEPAVGFDYNEIYQNSIVNHAGRNRLIASLAQLCLAKGCQTLILVAQVSHGLLLEQAIPGARLVVGSGESKTPKLERRRIFEDFRGGSVRTVIATTLADEGLDLPSMDSLILAGAGKSPVKTVQRVGRTMRPSPGKERAVVFDFTDYHNGMMANQSKERVATYRDYEWPTYTYHHVFETP
jgi:superfamily II DNA or RNA helicase